jgi:hypothetical protein
MEVGVIGHNFEMGHPRKIPAKFGLIWSNGFRGEYLNVKYLHLSYTCS